MVGKYCLQVVAFAGRVDRHHIDKVTRPLSMQMMRLFDMATR
jgi:hypothetical protein